MLGPSAFVHILLFVLFVFLWIFIFHSKKLHRNELWNTSVWVKWELSWALCGRPNCSTPPGKQVDRIHHELWKRLFQFPLLREKGPRYLASDTTCLSSQILWIRNSNSRDGLSVPRPVGPWLVTLEGEVWLRGWALGSSEGVRVIPGQEPSQSLYHSNVSACAAEAALCRFIHSQIWGLD